MLSLLNIKDSFQSILTPNTLLLKQKSEKDKRWSNDSFSFFLINEWTGFIRVSSGTVFFAEYCTVPFFGNGEITVPQSASIVLFFWFLWKWGGEKLLVGMKRFRVLVPEMWVLKYGPKNVYLYDINYCLEAGILLHQEIQFKTSRHKQDNLMLIAYKKFFWYYLLKTFNFKRTERVIKTWILICHLVSHLTLFA